MIDKKIFCYCPKKFWIFSMWSEKMLRYLQVLTQRRQSPSFVMYTKIQQTTIISFQKLIILCSWVGFYLHDVVSVVIATATCLAGWLSHSGKLSKRLNLSENFRPSESPIILVSWNPLRRYTIPRGIPSAGALNTWGVGKLAIFDEYLRLSRKQCDIGRWLLCNVNRKLHDIIFDDLEWP